MSWGINLKGFIFLYFRIYIHLPLWRLAKIDSGGTADLNPGRSDSAVRATHLKHFCLSGALNKLYIISRRLKTSVVSIVLHLQY